MALEYEDLTLDHPGYNEPLYMKWNPEEYDRPTSELAQRIIANYNNDISCVVIIYGDPRIGKSALGFKALIQAFNYLFDWRDLKRIYDNCIGYHPLQVIRDWRSVMRSSHIDPKFRNNELPAYIWDDGGVWLFNQDYNKPMVKDVMKYLQIVFTKIKTIIITTPTPKVLTAGLRTIPASVWLKVYFRYGKYPKYFDTRSNRNEIILSQQPDHMRFGRYAIEYNPFMSADLKSQKVWRGYKEYFDCRFPDSIYKRYKPERDSYLVDIEDRIEMNLMIEHRKQLDLWKKQTEALQKIQPEVYT